MVHAALARAVAVGKLWQAAIDGGILHDRMFAFQNHALEDMHRVHIRRQVVNSVTAHTC